MPGGSGDLTLAELQEMASRQQQQLEAQQQVRYVLFLLIVTNEHVFSFCLIGLMTLVWSGVKQSAFFFLFFFFRRFKSRSRFDQAQVLSPQKTFFYTHFLMFLKGEIIAWLQLVKDLVLTFKFFKLSLFLSVAT